MKIFKDGKVYVQKNDMVYVNHSDMAIPASIFMKLFGNGIVIIDNSNRYEFVEFSEPSEVEFFKGIDWIVDFEDIKDLSEEEIVSLGQQVAEEKNEKAKAFNSLSEEERKAHYEATVQQMEQYDFKMHTLRDVIMYKRGELSFELPAGVECLMTKQPEENKGVKAFVKRILNGVKKQQ